MLLDVSSLFAKNLSLVDGEVEVLDIGEKGLGRVQGINFFAEISEDVSGLSTLSFCLYTAGNEEGTEDKEEILVTPEYPLSRLKKGFSCSFELPATKNRYLLLEVNKTGTATGGKFWAGLSSSEQYAAHNL